MGGFPRVVRKTGSGQKGSADRRERKASRKQDHIVGNKTDKLEKEAVERGMLAQPKG